MAARPTSRTSVVAVWLTRLRLLAATALLWGLFHFVAGPLAVPRGLDRPVLLVAAPHPLVAALVVALVLVAGGAAALFIAGRDRHLALMAVGLALALWAAEGGARGGTMESWLRFANERPGPPRGAPYWSLLADYACFAGALAVLAVLSERLQFNAGGERSWRQAARSALALDEPPAERRLGPLALLLTTLVAGVVTLVLTGPVAQAVYRGQVYFAVGVGFVAGTWVTTHVLPVRHPLWFWSPPLLLGIIGAIAAALRPTLLLPELYRGSDTIPAWGLVRALPLETAGVGVFAALWTLRSKAPPQPAPATS